MLKHLLLSATLLFSGSLLAADNPRVLLTTSFGDIELELDAEKAPISTQNFLGYVEGGFYNGTQFHRVIPNFMIQGGGFDERMVQKTPFKPIQNEANNGLRNDRGTIAMARTQDINSATSQFFINVNDNDFLNHGGRDYGYAVFGKVVKGMNVVDRISNVRTGSRAGHRDVPVEPVLILNAKKL